MIIINIVYSTSKVNYGVWHAATIGTKYLQQRFGIKSLLAICEATENDILPSAEHVHLSNLQKKEDGFQKWLTSFPRHETIVVTHGAWLLPSRIGRWASKIGYKWVYVPQGMLQPWSFKEKWLRKLLYFSLIEKRIVRHADVVRAVSEDEFVHLRSLIKNRITMIFNGVELEDPKLDFATEPTTLQKEKPPLKFLFLARLHKKKGIVPLVKAWNEVMRRNDKVLLMIVGPDDGELSQFDNLVGDNIQYLGPRYGDDKAQLLRDAHYYVLPSFSEGFPTSVVEAMCYGVIPVISDGCNMPQIFSERLGYRVEPNIDSIKDVLRRLSNVDEYDSSIAISNREYVLQHLGSDRIGEKLYKLYQDILN